MGIRDVWTQNKYFRFYTYLAAYFVLGSSFALISALLNSNSRLVLGGLQVIAVFLLSWIVFCALAIRRQRNHELKLEIKSGSSLKPLLKEHIVAVILIVLFSFLFIKDFNEEKDERLVTHPSALEHLEGLLLPTRDTLPPYYEGDKRSYGFGSNEACFGDFRFRNFEGGAYCYRFFDTTTALGYDSADKNRFEPYKYTLLNSETLTFQANSYPNEAPISLFPYDLDTYVKGLQELGISYSSQEFEFDGIRGVMLTYSIEVPSVGTNTPITRNVQKMFWGDQSRLSIKWSTPAPKMRSIEEVLNLLLTMKISTGAGLSEFGSSSGGATIIGSPVNISSYEFTDIATSTKYQRYRAYY